MDNPYRALTAVLLAYLENIRTGSGRLLRIPLIIDEETTKKQWSGNRDNARAGGLHRQARYHLMASLFTTLLWLPVLP